MMIALGHRGGDRITEDRCGWRKEKEFILFEKKKPRKHELRDFPGKKRQNKSTNSRVDFTEEEPVRRLIGPLEGEKSRGKSEGEYYTL